MEPPIFNSLHVFEVAEDEVKVAHVDVDHGVLLHETPVDDAGEFVEDALLLYEGGFDGAGLEQIRVVAHLPQLHQHVHDAEEVAVVQGLLGLVAVDVFVVEEALAPGKVALNDMLNFLWQLLFYITFKASQEEGTQDALELLDY